MKNREWLESLSDEKLAETAQIVCEICPAYMGHGSCYRGGDHCARNTKWWLAQEHEPPKKEFTQDQLKKVFKDKFMERRAIGILEIEELIGELFR